MLSDFINKLMEIVYLTGCVGNDVDKRIYRPLGAYQSAWYLRNFSYDVQVIDFIHQVSEDRIIKALNKFIDSDTKIFAYGAMVSVIAPETQVFLKKVERILNHVKKNFPHVTIVGAGASVSLMSRLYRNKTLFDYILFGHAEDTMLALANYICRKGPCPPFEFLDGNKIIRETFPVQVENKFDIKTCNHKWHDRDFIQTNETLPLELGRGCIFKCKFCQYPYIGKSKNDFTRSLDLVLEEIQYNYDKWKVTNYYMLDDTFNADHERLKSFTDAVKSLSFEINYCGYIRLDLVHSFPNSAQLLQESGLIGAYFGMESFNPISSNMVGKGWIGKNGKTFLKNLYHDIWDKKVSIHANFICGLPPETYDDLLATHDWLAENEIPQWQWAPLQINRDSHNQFTSEFERNSEDYGFDWEVNNGKIQWKTEYCDAELAIEWRHKLNSLRVPYIKPGCWDLLELGTYGLDLSESMHLKKKDLPWNQIVEGRKQFLTNYWKELMSS
jgi:radical SAM superfamily enzyme YgiQ (UPF0313 family)